jgi:hypothetical protein
VFYFFVSSCLGGSIPLGAVGGACLRRFVSRGAEADAAFLGRGRRRHELADGLENDLEFLVVLAEFPFQLGQFRCQIFVGGQDIAKADKRPHNGNVHFDGAGCVVRSKAWRRLAR